MLDKFFKTSVIAIAIFSLIATVHIITSPTNAIAEDNASQNLDNYLKALDAKVNQVANEVNVLKGAMNKNTANLEDSKTKMITKVNHIESEFRQLQQSISDYEKDLNRIKNEVDAYKNRVK